VRDSTVIQWNDGTPPKRGSVERMTIRTRDLHRGEVRIGVQRGPLRSSDIDQKPAPNCGFVDGRPAPRRPLRRRRRVARYSCVTHDRRSSTRHGPVGGGVVETVEEYRRAAPEPQRTTLLALRATLRELLPGAEERRHDLRSAPGAGCIVGWRHRGKERTAGARRRPAGGGRRPGCWGRSQTVGRLALFASAVREGIGVGVWGGLDSRERAGPR
jgi:hypothetical protein